MLDHHTVAHANDICGDRIPGQRSAGIAAVQHDDVSFRYDEIVHVSRADGQALDQIEETFAARCYPRAMLNVLRGSKALG